MSSLYRKYRPTQFKELVGQDHIRSSIESALKAGRVGHAYLFSGPRGTGKTTLARLLARAVNCTGKKDGIEACGKCEICQEITRGQSVDIVEIDAASNRGIDEIRDLREKIVFAPTRTEYKVYIIDEVHMLTKEAFNALLKTLEEPPSHAIFILATTELHKVPETIISRCQRYQFYRAPIEKIAEVLLAVAKQEKLELTEEAAKLIASRAEGSFRDALTLLGNVSNAENLDEATIRTLIGLPKTEVIESFLKAIQSGNVVELAGLISAHLETGGDLAVLVRVLATELRRRIFSKPENAEAVLWTTFLETLLLSLVKARHSIDAEAVLAATLINLAAERQKIKPSETSAELASVIDIVKDKEPEIETPSVDALTAQPPRAADSEHFWPLFLEAIKTKNHALYAVIRSAHLEALTDSKLTIAVKFRFYLERLYEAKNRKLIEALATEIAGRPIVLECQVKTDLDVPGGKEEDLMGAVVEVFELEEVK